VSFTASPLEENPQFTQEFHQLGLKAWPRFLQHSDTHSWPALYDAFPQYQLLLRDTAGELVGIGHTVPLIWDGTLEDLPTSIESIIRRGLAVKALAAKEKGIVPNTLSALAAIVPQQHQRQGHSARILLAMRQIALAHGIERLIAPVRPILKAAYPLQPFERYAAWTRQDGSPFDPWIRVHSDLGAKILQVLPEGMVVKGSLAQWQEWTGMCFPDTGPYIVPGAMQPVDINTNNGTGRYADPNLWMLHPVQ
jgi:hypothetical protein